MNEVNILNLPKVLTYKTINGKRVFVHTKHNWDEYIRNYSKEYDYGEIHGYNPLDVLQGINDDETSPSFHKNYWLILEKNGVRWYEIPNEY